MGTHRISGRLEGQASWKGHKPREFHTMRQELAIYVFMKLMVIECVPRIRHLRAVGTQLWKFQKHPHLHAIFIQMREWVSEWVKSRSVVSPLFATPWTVAHQAPPSMEFFRQEYWSRLPFPSPGDLSDLGIKPGSPALRADTLLSEPPGNRKWGTGS